jgi:glycine/D-amino acid oxidase-like deaminating enzyme
LSEARLPGMRIVVVGAGAIGASVAHATARAGAQVTIVERLFPGSGTTAATFATLGALAQTPRSFHELHLRGIEAHERLARELGGSWLHLDGALFWEADREKGDVLGEAVRQERAWGAPFEDLQPARVRELEPDVAIDRSVRVVHRAPRDGWIGGVELASAAVSAAVERRGARLVTGTVVAASPDGVRLDDGRSYAADVVVNAAGPDAERIARLAGQSLALGRIVGAVVVSEPAPVRLRHVLKTTATRLRPDGGGRILFYGEHFGARAGDGAHEAPDPQLGGAAISAATDVLPGLASVRAEAVRVGIRAEPVDGLPIVGRGTACDWLYHVVTRSGITLAAILGELVATDLSGRATDLHAFRPDRASLAVRAER